MLEKVNKALYFYCPTKNRHYLYCAQLTEEIYLFRCSETGFYHELNDNQIFELMHVENTDKARHSKEVLAYLEDKEQIRLKKLLRRIKDDSAY